MEAIYDKGQGLKVTLLGQSISQVRKHKASVKLEDRTVRSRMTLSAMRGTGISIANPRGIDLGTVEGQRDGSFERVGRWDNDDRCLAILRVAMNGR
ncbi:hypothetical protein RND71_016367 [Anisodus tanguticus]|uniref:Uncharacterized protein n=1 Tax=Anisodus tanguticus TaxID=243964 RepID=A0AAE1S609_9SOLA|nr:hypothetical protein RND71_016367 [Anisodus tanguticus]